jgi:hypothetical protein
VPHFDTALNVINNAALELGLIDSALSNPFTSTDQNIIQLRTLLTRVGRMLVRARPWSHLTREYTFNTVDGTESYALPTGFDRFRHATAWNRDTDWPLGGPFSPSQWQAVKTSTVAGAVVRPFRVFGNLLYLYPTPTAAEAIYYEYVSQYWVLPVAGSPTAPTLTVTATSTDVLWFDEPLLVAGLKLAFNRAKQRDTTYAQAEYDEVFRAVAGGDSAAPTVRIAGSNTVPLLGWQNIPETGYGS